MKEVDRDNLETGKEYYVVSTRYDGNGNTIINELCNKHMARFMKNEVTQDSNGMTLSFFSNYRALKNKNNIIGYEVCLNKHFRFYEKDAFLKVQESMEKRAVNLALQEIIGDQWFHWY